MAARFLWKLIFRSGILSGQELHLPLGELTVGRGAEWDVDLPLSEKFEGEHCVLRVDEAGVILQPLKMRCKVNNRRVKNEQLLLNAGQLIDIGGCAFTLAQAGTQVQQHLQQRASQLQTYSMRHRWLRVWGVLLPSGLASLILAALLYASQELRASVNFSSYEPFNIESYRTALQKTGIAQVSVEHDETGTVTLSGTCSDTTKLEPFLNRLVEIGVSYRNQVICQDVLQRSVAYLLHTNGYRHAHVASGPALGTVVITGNIRADERWFAVTQQLNQLPGLRSWTVNNDIDETMTNLVAALREKDLLAKLSIVRQDDVLTITGQLLPEQQKILHAILADYRQQNQSETLRIVYQNIPALQQEARIFPAPIVSFSGNSRAVSLQLANGIQVQAGSTLPSGYIITALDEAGIELQKEGELVHLPLDL